MAEVQKGGTYAWSVLAILALIYVQNQWSRYSLNYMSRTGAQEMFRDGVRRPLLDGVERQPAAVAGPTLSGIEPFTRPPARPPASSSFSRSRREKTASAGPSS